MFQQMKNIDTAFKQIRSFCIALIALCTFICAFTVYWSYDMVKSGQQRIYVLANGKVLEAFSAGRKDNIPVEARDHVKTFHELFFTLDPDDEMIRNNLGRSLYLADETAKREYDNLRENGYYASIISGNVSQQVETDSVFIDLTSHPYHFRYYGRQRIIRTTTSVVRSLETEGYLRSVARTDNNPHGFLIEKWTITANQDIQVQNR